MDIKKVNQHVKWEKYLDITDKRKWAGYSRKKNLDIDFIRAFKDRLNWKILSEYYPFTMEQLDEFFPYLDIKNICLFQKLPEAFMDKYEKYLDWDYLSIKQVMSEDFIRRHKDQVAWNEISIYQKFSEAFIEEFTEQLNWTWICCTQTLSEPFIEKHIDKIHWKSISGKQELSEEFMTKYADKLDWSELSFIQYMSERFIYKFADKVNFHLLYQNDKLEFSDKFIEDFHDTCPALEKEYNTRCHIKKMSHVKTLNMVYGQNYTDYDDLSNMNDINWTGIYFDNIHK